MNDFERINAPHVTKLLDQLAKVAKSARSQRAGADEIARLLAPVAEAMARAGSLPAPSASSGPTLPPCGDAEFAAVLAAVAQMHPQRTAMLADAVPAHLIRPLIIVLEARRDDLAAQAKSWGVTV